MKRPDYFMEKLNSLMQSFRRVSNGQRNKKVLSAAVRKAFRSQYSVQLNDLKSKIQPNPEEVIRMKEAL